MTCAISMAGMTSGKIDLTTLDINY